MSLILVPFLTLPGVRKTILHKHPVQTCGGLGPVYVQTVVVVVVVVCFCCRCHYLFIACEPSQHMAAADRENLLWRSADSLLSCLFMLGSFLIRQGIGGVLCELEGHVYVCVCVCVCICMSILASDCMIVWEQGGGQLLGPCDV